MSTQKSLSGWRLVLSPAYLLPFFTVCLAEALPALGYAIYGTILPSALGDVGGLTYASWASLLYSVLAVLGSAAMGQGVRSYGLRVVAGASVSLFGLGSGIAVVASDFIAVLVGRGLQGLGGGLLAGLGFLFIRLLFPPSVWTRLFAALSAVWGIAALSGPAVGAIAVVLGGWRTAFIILAVLALGVGILMIVLTPPGYRQEGENTLFKPPPFLRLLGLGAGAFLVALAGIASTIEAGLGLLTAGLAGVAFILRRDRQSDNPLLPREALRPMTPLGSVLFLALALNLTVGFSIYGPLFMQELYGFSVLEAGYVLMAVAMGWTVAEILSAHTPPDWRFGALIGGPLVSACGLALAGVSLGYAPALWVVLGVFLNGLGIGMAWPHLSHLGLSLAPKEEAEVAAGGVPTMHRLGTTFGAALTGALANMAGLDSALDRETLIAAARWTHLPFVPLLLLSAGLIACSLRRHR